jgi:hypothetical protein
MLTFLIGYLIERAILRLAIRCVIPAALLVWMLGGCVAIDAAVHDLTNGAGRSNYAGTLPHHVRLLGRATRASGCRAHDGLPDSACTPGAVFADATLSEICTPGYTRAVRNVSYDTKRAIYRAYGMRRHFNGASGEADHLVPLALAGANSSRNLWPEAATPYPGSHEKDQLEAYLAHAVCAHKISLSRAQAEIATNWRATFYRIGPGVLRKWGGRYRQ